MNEEIISEQPITDPELPNRQRMHIDQLHSWCKDFIAKSSQWRSSYEIDWDLYDRNCEGIYDTALKNKKQAWQSTVFVGLTASHREIILAHLYQVLFGGKPQLEIEKRYDSPMEVNQNRNIRDIILRQIEISDFKKKINAVLDEASRYGSGFCRVRWEKKEENRPIKEPIPEPLNNPMAILRKMQGRSQITGYSTNLQKVITYKGVQIDQYQIRDVFPDPKSIDIKGNSIAVRFYLNYGDVVEGVRQGYYLQEAVEKLKHLSSEENVPADKSVSLADRKEQDVKSTKTEYGNKLICYEMWARIPQKWVVLDEKYADNDPESLIPARIIFHDNCILAIELSDEYDGEPPIMKCDYWHIANRFYGGGIPWMLKDSQAVTNEVVNQRLDNGALILNKSFGVLEKALVNPEQDLVSKPGQILRLDDTVVQDVRQALMELPISDTPLRAGFSEVNEAERWAQERTSANRVTLGTAGLVKDSNQTLGGQQLLKQSAGEKFAYVGTMIENTFLLECYKHIWKLFYKNADEQEVVKSIGLERFGTFEWLTPEQIEYDYVYTPTGIFSMENKNMRLMRLTQILQMFAMSPFVNLEAFFNNMMKLNDENPEDFKLKMPMGLPPGMGIPPGMIGGQNTGNQGNPMQPARMPPPGAPPNAGAQ